MIALLPQSWRRGVGWGCVAESELGSGPGSGPGVWTGEWAGAWAGAAEALSVAAF